jgi:hypothetical protein
MARTITRSISLLQAAQGMVQVILVRMARILAAYGLVGVYNMYCCYVYHERLISRQVKAALIQQQQVVVVALLLYQWLTIVALLPSIDVANHDASADSKTRVASAYAVFRIVSWNQMCDWSL